MKISTLVMCASALCLFTLMGCDQATEPTQSITLTAPTAGAEFLVGDTVAVKWNESIATPKLSYTFNEAELGWQAFSSASVLPVSGQEVKVILPTSSYSNTFQIKVEDGAGAYQAATSEPLSVKYIVVTNPTAGQTITVGQTVNITWKAATGRLSSIRLMLSTDGGISFEDMRTTSSQPDAGSYAWVVGSEESGVEFAYPSTNCIIKLRDYNNGDYNDQTGKFTVQQ